MPEPGQFDIGDLDLDDVVFEDATPEVTDKPVRKRRTRSDAGQPRGTRTAGANARPTALKKLSTGLLKPWAQVASTLSMSLPVTAGVLLSRGEETCDALVSIASKHPRMLKALEATMQVSDYGEIIQTCLLVGVAVQVDMGKIAPDSPMAMMFGITDLWAQLHPDKAEAMQQEQMATSNGFDLRTPQGI